MGPTTESQSTAAATSGSRTPATIPSQNLSVPPRRSLLLEHREDRYHPKGHPPPARIRALTRAAEVAVLTAREAAVVTAAGTVVTAEMVAMAETGAVTVGTAETAMA